MLSDNTVIEEKKAGKGYKKLGEKGVAFKKGRWVRVSLTEVTFELKT